MLFSASNDGMLSPFLAFCFICEIASPCIAECRSTLNFPLAINRSQFCIVSIYFCVVSNCGTTSTVKVLSSVNDFSSLMLFRLFFRDLYGIAASRLVVVGGSSPPTLTSCLLIVIDTLLKYLVSWITCLNMVC